MPVNRTLGLLAAAVLAVVIAWFAMRTPAVPPAHDVRPDASRGVPSDDRAQVAALARGAANDGVERLPPLAAPLRTLIADLRRRADAGDAGAQCRLFTEYVHCAAQRRRTQDLLDTASYRESRLDAATTPAQRAEALRALRSMDQDLQLVEIGQDAEHCRDVEIPSADERLRGLRDAALRGHLPSIALYVRGKGFTGRLRQLPQLRAYRGEAERLALLAAREGDLQTLFTLAAAYDPDDASGSLLGEAVVPDPMKALSYYQQLRMLHADPARANAAEANAYLDRKIAVLSDGVPRERIDAARRDAERRLARWRAPAPGARVLVSGITTSPQDSLLRETCADDGDRLQGEFFIRLPDGTLMKPPPEDVR